MKASYSLISHVGSVTRTFEHRLIKSLSIWIWNFWLFLRFLFKLFQWYMRVSSLSRQGKEIKIDTLGLFSMLFWIPKQVLDPNILAFYLILLNISILCYFHEVIRLPLIWWDWSLILIAKILPIPQIRTLIGGVRLRQRTNRVLNRTYIQNNFIFFINLLEVILFLCFQFIGHHWFWLLFLTIIDHDFAGVHHYLFGDSHLVLDRLINGFLRLLEISSIFISLKFLIFSLFKGLNARETHCWIHDLVKLIVNYNFILISMI